MGVNSIVIKEAEDNLSHKFCKTRTISLMMEDSSLILRLLTLAVR